MLSGLRQLPRDSRDTLFVLAVIGWILLPQTAHLPLWCSALAFGVLLWRGSLAWRQRPLPGRWWMLLLLALAVAATLATHRTLLGRDAGVTLVVVLLAFKTLELRARRDAFVVFFLGFFSMLTQFFYSQSLLTAASMLLGLLSLLTALVNSHMPVGRPSLWQSARLAGSLALLGAPIMVLLFLLFPRLAPLWGTPHDAMTGRSGLSEQMEVGSIASLALDDSVAMRLRFEGTPPRADQMYFRGPVLSSFDGRQWRQLPYSLAPQSAAEAQLEIGGEAVAYEITLEPSNRPWLPLLEMTVEAPELPAMRARLTRELQWTSSSPVHELLRMKARSHPSYRYGASLSDAQLRVYRQLPAGSNPRTRELAAELLSDPRHGDAQALIDAALAMLRTGGYSYTLEPGLYGQHTADEFWFLRKQGFCEHIASSFVILMRAMGIPARVVTGYQGGERNAVDGYWVVRQSDAHAWAEVWLAGQGWRRVDPTSSVAPGRTGALQRLPTPRGAIGNALTNAVSPALAAQVRALWEAANNGWNQWILNYSQGSQLKLLEKLGFESPSWQDLGRVLLVCIVLVSLSAAAWTLWERRRQDPWLRLLHAAQARLRQAGIAVPPGATPRAMAELLARPSDAGRSPRQWTVTRRWLLRLEALRYAPPRSAPGAGELARLKHELKHLNWPL